VLLKSLKKWSRWNEETGYGLPDLPEAIGLSGNACGALSALIWMNTLPGVKNTRENPRLF